MNLKLVIAEKPSVAQSYAKVLGANKRGDGYLEGNGYIVSWCVGHLVELAEPEAYDERYAKWKYEDLPILPEKWKYEISPGTKKQFMVLKGLMNRNDVTEITCATDSGREGELIFRLVYEMCGCKKPVKRLWISSMEDDAIREGFDNLHDSKEYDALYEAALCRERADWIVGMNATRLFSCLYGQTLNVGRVMTPTLAMVVTRDAEIKAFVPKPFYTVQITVGGITAVSRRFETKEEAIALLARCMDVEGDILVKSVDRKERTEHPPLLYDLTTLQRDANRILGYTAQQTLDYTQSLYEKKLVTYPRTDSRYLTDDMLSVIPSLVNGVSKKYGAGNVPISQASRVVNSKKVSDHTALTPTKATATADINSLPAGEKEILKLISVRMMCAVGEDHRYAETAAVFTCGGEDFSCKSKEILKNGWKEIWQRFYPSKVKDEDEVSVSAAFIPEAGTRLKADDISVKEGQTSNRQHFTEDSLLSAMESAGADEMPEEAERKGIGTPATRAGIIEKLVQKGFIERKGDKKAKYLIATDKGTALITVMPEQIQSPSMTAEWEQKLLAVEHGEMSPDEFMDGICEMISSLVSDYEKVKGVDALMSRNKVAGICPHCGSEVLEKQKGWFCSNRECRFVLWKDNAYFNKIGKRMTENVADQLLRDGRVHLKGCKSAKTGKTYDADLVMMTEDDGRPSFSLEFEKPKKKGAKSDQKKQQD